MQSTVGDKPRLIKVPANHTWNKTFLQEAEALIAHDEGTNVLHVASCVDNIGTIDVLLKYGAKVDTPTVLGRTALHCSAYSGFAAIVRTLLEHGANYNLRLLDGRTPLHDAALMGHTDACIALLEAGADPYIQSYHNFLSPIDIAATPELVKILTTVVSMLHISYSWRLFITFNRCSGT